MRARRWTAAATLAASAIGLGGCSYGPEYAATVTADGHVQLEWCNDGDLLVVVGDSELEVDYSNSGRPGMSAVDLTAVPAGQCTPAPPTLQPETVIQVLPSSPSAERPVLTFRPTDLTEGRYLHQGRLISPSSWRAACGVDEEPLIGIPMLIILFRDVYRREFPNPNSKVTWTIAMLMFWPCIPFYLYHYGFRPRNGDTNSA